jgi:dihydrofolate reductase
MGVSKLIYSMNPSLDGYIAGPDGEISAGAPSEEVHRAHNTHTGELAAHLCGRRLYEVMTYWDDFAEREPDAPEYELEFARIWCALPKIVFSNTLTEVGPNATLATEDVPTTIGRLRQEAGGDIAVGGAELAGECIRLGLVDEFRLFVTPVVIGGGTPFFPKGVQLDLRLIESRSYGSGTVYLRYERVDAG